MKTIQNKQPDYITGILTSYVKLLNEKNVIEIDVPVMEWDNTTSFDFVINGWICVKRIPEPDIDGILVDCISTNIELLYTDKGILPTLDKVRELLAQNPDIQTTAQTFNEYSACSGASKQLNSLFNDFGKIFK